MAILGLLEERELHGYEIRRQLRDQLGLLANVSFGSLYPALNRLEKAGAVEAVDASAESATVVTPATGSLSGEWAALRARRHSSPRGRRSRKVFRITPSGRQLFVELLADQGSAEDARSFAPGARLALLERRRAQLVQRLDEIAHAKNDNELDVYARSVVEHTTESVAQDIAWLDRLLATERSDGQASTQERSTVAVRQGLEPRRAVQTEH
jgi:DNA-binding PadR family transcriptional regulator